MTGMYVFFLITETNEFLTPILIGGVTDGIRFDSALDVANVQNEKRALHGARKSEILKILLM